MSNTSSANFQYLTVSITNGTKNVLHAPTGNEPYEEGVIISSSGGTMNYVWGRTNVNVLTIACLTGN